MSKIICDVCGTSYPDTASQCPICGCVRPGEAKSVTGDTAASEAGNTYTYVKGGRFSKSNVRKRNKASGGYVPASEPVNNESESSGNKGLIIAAIVLFLAIIAVVIYISVQFFLPGINTSDPTTLPSQSQQTRPSESGSPEIPCQSLKLDISEITFDDTTARIIYPTVSPVNTTDAVVFRSSDEAVATVDQNGLITPIGPGQAKIIVTCGDVTVECAINCTFELPTINTNPTEPSKPVEEFLLNRDDITFRIKGDSWVIYNGNVPLNEITWTSDDETIATIKNGKVVAVGNGTTNVHGEYNGEKASCIIRCVLPDSDDSNTGSGGNITEDGGQSHTYELKNTAGGYNDDVTLVSGESFTMWLVDEAGNKVSGVVWTVAEDGICTVDDGLVTAIGSGSTTVTATYQEVPYSFKLRVVLGR